MTSPKSRAHPSSITYRATNRIARSRGIPPRPSHTSIVRMVPRNENIERICDSAAKRTSDVPDNMPRKPRSEAARQRRREEDVRKEERRTEALTGQKREREDRVAIGTPGPRPRNMEALRKIEPERLESERSMRKRHSQWSGDFGESVGLSGDRKPSVGKATIRDDIATRKGTGVEKDYSRGIRNMIP